MSRFDSELPKAASPFLNFGLRDEALLQPASVFGGLPESYNRYLMIGHNGNGDMICIDQESGAVNHDNNMDVVFMNSSVTALAHSLCVFSEQMGGRDADACCREILEIDPAAISRGSFWTGG